MPHLVIAHSPNAPLTGALGPALLAALHEALGAVQTFPLESLKSRLLQHDVFIVADGQSQAFVHAELALLAGRDFSIRQQLGQVLADGLEQHLSAHASAVPCQLSVEVREMDRSTYVKRALPPPHVAPHHP